MNKRIYSIDLDVIQYTYISGKTETMFHAWIHRTRNKETTTKQYRDLTRSSVARVRKMQDALYNRENN